MIQRILLFGVIVVAMALGTPSVLERLSSTDDPVAATAISPPTSPLVIADVRITDRDGRLIYRGDVDLRPELARIERGERDPHRNDGSVFQNREARLPRQERGYYREYVVRTPGIDHAGPQRLVLGANGEVYYTADHYRRFTRIQ